MGKAQKLVLDAGPLINLTREEILSRGENLYATPAVIREIRDEAARQRLELIKDDITVQQPTKEAVKFATDFAKLTGDGFVLSSQDIEVIALGYDLVTDKSKLRKRPQQMDNQNIVESAPQVEQKEDTKPDDDGFVTVKSKAPKPRKGRKAPPPPPVHEVTEQLSQLSAGGENEDDSDWSDDGWINPENLQEQVSKEQANTSSVLEDIEVAIASRDYAVQNTSLQIGIPAVNERGLRIKKLKNYVQRCYACFKLVPLNPERDTLQFCPQCGGHTLTRVSTSVDKNGQVHVNLKAKMQWITRGDRYNVPNPQSQRARRQQHDTKKEFYVEDQPEYIKAVKKQNWIQRRNDKMVNEYIGPSTVDTAVSPFLPIRAMPHKVQIGRGRNANATGRKTQDIE